MSSLQHASKRSRRSVPWGRCGADGRRNRASSSPEGVVLSKALGPPGWPLGIWCAVCSWRSCAMGGGVLPRLHTFPTVPEYVPSTTEPQRLRAHQTPVTAEITAETAVRAFKPVPCQTGRVTTQPWHGAQRAANVGVLRVHVRPHVLCPHTRRSKLKRKRGEHNGGFAFPQHTAASSLRHVAERRVAKGPVGDRQCRGLPGAGPPRYSVLQSREPGQKTRQPNGPEGPRHSRQPTVSAPRDTPSYPPGCFLSGRGRAGRKRQ